MSTILLRWESLPWCYMCSLLQFAWSAACSLCSLLFMSVYLQSNVVARMLTIIMAVRQVKKHMDYWVTYIYMWELLYKWSVNKSNAYKYGRELQIDTWFNNVVISENPTFAYAWNLNMMLKCMSLAVVCYCGDAVIWTRTCLDSPSILIKYSLWTILTVPCIAGSVDCCILIYIIE